MKTPHFHLGSDGSRIVAWGHATSPRARRWIGLSVLLGLAACGALVAAGVAQRAQLLEAQDQLAERASRRPMPMVPAASAPAMPTMTPARLDAWNAVVRQLNTAWPAVFDLLERRTPTTVALLSVEPEARRLRLRLTAEARNLPDLLDFAQALREDEQVSDVVLVRHDTDEQNPQQPVRLTLDVAMHPPVPMAVATSASSPSGAASQAAASDAASVPLQASSAASAPMAPSAASAASASGGVVKTGQGKSVAPSASASARASGARP